MSRTAIVLLLGGGGHGVVVGDAARAAGYIVAGCLDDEHGIAGRAEEAGLKWLGGLDDLAEVVTKLSDELLIHAAFGDGILRRQWLENARAECPGASLAPIIHPSSIVSPSAMIEDGAFIRPLAIVNARARIGRGTIVNSGAIIEHDCLIGPFAHIAPGAILLGAATVGDDAMIGSGAKVLPGVEIGADCTLGSGAVATVNLPPGTTATGVPARAVLTTES